MAGCSCVCDVEEYTIGSAWDTERNVERRRRRSESGEPLAQPESIYDIKNVISIATVAASGIANKTVTER